MTASQLTTDMALAARAAILSPAATKAEPTVEQAESTGAKEVIPYLDDDWSEIKDDNMFVIEGKRVPNDTESEDNEEDDNKDNQTLDEDRSSGSECDESDKQEPEQEAQDDIEYDMDDELYDQSDSESCLFSLDEVERANATERAEKLLKAELVDAMGGKLKAEALAEERAFEIDVWKKAHNFELERNHQLTSKVTFTKQKAKEEMEALKDTAAYHIRRADEAKKLEEISEAKIHLMSDELIREKEAFGQLVEMLEGIKLDKKRIEERCAELNTMLAMRNRQCQDFQRDAKVTSKWCKHLQEMLEEEIQQREHEEGLHRNTISWGNSLEDMLDMEIRQRKGLEQAKKSAEGRCKKLKKQLDEQIKQHKDAELAKERTSEWCDELARMLEEERQRSKNVEQANKGSSERCSELAKMLEEEIQRRKALQDDLEYVRAERDNLQDAVEEYIDMEDSERSEASKMMEVFSYFYPGLEKLNGDEFQDAMLELDAEDGLSVAHFQSYLSKL